MSRRMKYSGIEWTGEIPEDWGIIKVKHLFNVSRGRVISKLEAKDEGAYPVYSSQTENDGIFGYLDTYDYSGEALTWTTDGEKAGTVFYRNGKYNCTNICGILQKKDYSVIDTDIKFLFYSVKMVAEENKRPDTNGHKIMSNEMEKLSIAIPKYKEQKRITDILDIKTKQIENIKNTINEEIKNLEDYKKSIITEAVTKGLDKNVEMKDSGIEWIGEMPEDWNLIALKHLSKNYSGGTPSRNNLDYWENGDIPWVSSGEVNKEYIYDTNEKITRLGMLNSSAKIFPKNTVLVALNGQGKTKGKTAILKINATTNQSLTGFICDEIDLHYRYLYYKFISSYSFNRNYYSGGDNRDGIAANNLKTARLPIPSYLEQIKISDYLDQKCQLIDDSISIKKQQLEKLEEYKKSLIYEYVTGKKEVKDV